MAARVSTAALIGAWCLLAIGDATHAGYFTVVGLVCVALGLVVTAGVMISGVTLVPVERKWLAVPLTACVIYAAYNPTRAYLYQHGARLVLIETAAGVTAVAAVVLVFIGERWRAAGWWTVAGLALISGLLTLGLIGNPHIDVWDVLQQSSTGLLHGSDMYRQHWSDSTGLQAVYPYLPWSTVLLAPFRWVTGDVRVGLLLAIIVTASLLRRRGPNADVVSCLLLVAPGWVLLVNRSWTEPLLVLLVATAILAIRSGRGGLAVVALAVALACKQHIVLLVPLFALWPGFGIRRTLTSIGLAVLGVLPWVIAGPHDFWHDAVHANLALGDRSDALDLPAVFTRHGSHVGFWLAALFLVASYAVVIARSPRNASGLALGAALVMWAFDLANRQTFFNHYQLPLGLLVVGIALAGGPDPAEPLPDRSSAPSMAQ